MFINWYFLLCMFPPFGHLIEDNRDPGSKYLANDFSGPTENVVERSSPYFFVCISSWELMGGVMLVWEYNWSCFESPVLLTVLAEDCITLQGLSVLRPPPPPPNKHGRPVRWGFFTPHPPHISVLLLFLLLALFLSVLGIGMFFFPDPESWFISILDPGSLILIPNKTKNYLTWTGKEKNLSQLVNKLSRAFSTVCALRCRCSE